MDTVNCCFAWFPWNVNVSQILHKQLNKFDWSKIQLVVWQNNHRHLKFCLPSLLFQLLVGCLWWTTCFYLFVGLWLLRVTWWLLPPLWVWQFMALVDAVPSSSSGQCPDGSAVWKEEMCDSLAAQSFGPHQVAEARPVWVLLLITTAAAI